MMEFRVGAPANLPAKMVIRGVCILDDWVYVSFVMRARFTSKMAPGMGFEPMRSYGTTGSQGLRIIHSAHGMWNFISVIIPAYCPGTVSLSNSLSIKTITRRAPLAFLHIESQTLKSGSHQNGWLQRKLKEQWNANTATKTSFCPSNVHSVTNNSVQNIGCQKTMNAQNTGEQKSPVKKLHLQP